MISHILHTSQCRSLLTQTTSVPGSSSQVRAARLGRHIVEHGRRECDLEAVLSGAFLDPQREATVEHDVDSHRHRKGRVEVRDEVGRCERDARLADEGMAADRRQELRVDDRHDVAKRRGMLALVAVEAGDEVLPCVPCDLRGRWDVADDVVRGLRELERALVPEKARGGERGRGRA